MPPTNMFNTQGRGYPDVSVIGHNFEVVIGNVTTKTFFPPIFLLNKIFPAENIFLLNKIFPAENFSTNSDILFVGGQSYAVSGTSASAPTFAAMVTLINNARLNANKPPVGFLNPAIYSLGKFIFLGIFSKFL